MALQHCPRLRPPVSSGGNVHGGGRHTLSCFYELALPRRAASGGQEYTAKVRTEECPQAPGRQISARGWGLQPPVKRKAVWSLTPGTPWSSRLELRRSLWQGLRTPSIKLTRSPRSSPLKCLMSWFLVGSDGGRACGHPAHLPGSRESPRVGDRGTLDCGLPSLRNPLPLQSWGSSDFREQRNH